MNLPKILILGQPFNRNTGGGVTLCNLFYGYDPERLAVACYYYLIDEAVVADKCSNYYQLGDEEQVAMFPISLLRKKHSSGQIDISKNQQKNVGHETSGSRKKIVMNFVHPFLKKVGLFNLTYKTRPSKKFLKWVNAFSPDIIYAQGTSRSDIVFYNELMQVVDRPVVFHMMDDWLSSLSEGLLGSYWRKKVGKEFSHLLSKIDRLVTVSELMQQEYKNRFGTDSEVFHNAVDLNFWGKNQKKSYELGPSVEVLYTGRVGLGINESLLQFANALKIVNSRSSRKMTLTIQSNEKPAWVDSHDCVCFRQFVAYNDLPALLIKADFLLLPYDFSDDSLRFIRYSMPTKAPEYMITGVPIIAFSPADTALMKYLDRYKWGIPIVSERIEEIAAALLSVLDSEKTRQTVSENAIGTALNHHNVVKVSGAFREMMFCIASNQSENGKHAS